jgi:hypothetical protein
MFENHAPFSVERGNFDDSINDSNVKVAT